MQDTLTDFYPTPPALIDRMLEGIENIAEYGAILEPSAGKGDICDALAERSRSRYGQKPDIDVIEIDPNLQHILRGKGYNLVHDDFLTFKTPKQYGLIVANFPFSEGDQHLGKAVRMVVRKGGTLICLVNAETIRNPYTTVRKAIAGMLEEHDAEIEYIADAFRDAERPTDVEVALVRLTAPAPKRESVIIGELERAEAIAGTDQDPAALVDTDVVRSLISRFRLECESGIRLIDEYRALTPLMLESLPKPGESDQFNKPIIELTVRGGAAYTSAHANDYVRATRRKYWAALLQDERISGVYTSNVLDELANRLDELQDADFTEFNIRQLYADLQTSVSTGIETAILDMFDEFSRKFAWEKHAPNIHYFNGWKTNQSYRINRRIILPMNGFSAYGLKDRLDSYYIRDRISDMVKVFNYLAGDAALTDISTLVGKAMTMANEAGAFRNIDFHYFTATFYKKGTCHITFTDQRLLDKFNIYGSQRKGWLPPGYGRRRYADMDPEEQRVIDAFQGEAAYAEVMAGRAYYLADPAPLMLTG